MIKLINLLNEIKLGEAIVKVPKEILDRAWDAFNYIKKNIEELKQASSGSYTYPHIPPKFKNYFKFKDLKNQDLNISIGFYDDPKDVGAGRMDTYDDVLLVNLAYFDSDDFEGFEEIIEHELVHAMDPKVRDHKLFGTLYAKKGAEPEGSKFNLSKSGGKSDYEKSLEKYYKSPWEFDAFTAPLINTIKFNLDRVENSNTYKKLIFQLLSDIKNKSIDQILNDEKYNILPWFFSKKDMDPKNGSIVATIYKNELNKIKAWSTKPTLYQRFIKRIAQEI